jgi:hypothetical protein
MPPTDPIAPVVIVEPTHGVVVVLGAGIPINGLTPPLSISVAPRGIVPPLRLVMVPVPGVESGDAVPLDEAVPDDGRVQPLEVVDPAPPPSNVEVVPLIPDAAPPATPDEDGENPAQPKLLELLEPLGPIGIGPRPPGSIEVAPSGIPVWRGEDVEPRVPSGEVAPIPGVVVTLCAKPTSQLKRIAVAAMNNRLI